MHHHRKLLEVIYKSVTIWTMSCRFVDPVCCCQSRSQRAGNWRYIDEAACVVHESAGSQLCRLYRCFPPRAAHLQRCNISRDLQIHRADRLVEGERHVAVILVEEFVRIAGSRMSGSQSRIGKSARDEDLVFYTAGYPQCGRLFLYS